MSPTLAATWQSLGILESVIAEKRLTLYDEADELVIAEVGDDGREWRLTPAACDAWRAMQAAAAVDGVTLRIASAWRGIARQTELVRAKLDRGETIAAVLERLAPPGCSEHHTGRAVDVYEPGGPVLEEAFETTAAYAWLQQHAGRFGFTLSFPRANPNGYIYEPWHWCHHP
ncbi:M15 family metallopeptidase [Jeongeupia naejangsanensis]|uniref:D-alanyl-D-alanine carboxypeptidase family protein n=1 Tax=Jeongeupia naejangsanensis TaxID=613195 RepID=A0ABS2BLE7_9NEIS|nr:M15 family metallopeptidase [Jeongeupia naejangsanensis]MBM3116439.1 D-alanyl-D-alanine carboxypeptidase family protein [Jeongeupia naejangsanensis]